MSRIVISWFYYSMKIKYEKIILNWNFKQRNILSITHVYCCCMFSYLKSSFINTSHAQPYFLSRAAYSGGKKMRYSRLFHIWGKRIEEKGRTLAVLTFKSRDI